MQVISYVTPSCSVFVVANPDLVVAKVLARSTVREVWRNEGFDYQVN